MALKCYDMSQSPYSKSNAVKTIKAVPELKLWEVISMSLI